MRTSLRLYAFVVMNCNSFFPMFVMLYVIHYFLSSLLAAHGHGFIPLLLSNLLFMVAGSYYHYLNLLGYDEEAEYLVKFFVHKGSLQLYKNGWYGKSRSTIGDDEFTFPRKREENLIQQFATNVTSGWRAGDFKKMPFFLLRSTGARRSAL
ncbi:hypothetical protein Q3G72_034867 [Acer saccharum]|nr:hypothetical protein Q3G72_034867 [Acer saccharum]